VKKRRSLCGPRVESLEDRLAPGYTLGGLLGMALASVGLPVVDIGVLNGDSAASEVAPDPLAGAPDFAPTESISIVPDSPPSLTDTILLAMANEADAVQGGGSPAPAVAASAPAAAPSAAPSDGAVVTLAVTVPVDGGAGSDPVIETAPAQPQAVSAPSAGAGAAAASSGGGGSTPVVATGAPAAPDPVAAATAAADPTANVLSAAGITAASASVVSKGAVAAAAPVGGKNATSALASFLQQSTGTKTNYVNGVPDPGALGPDATSVIDYNYGDTYFTFPAIPFNGVTTPRTALTTTSGGSTLQGAEFQGEITYPTDLSGGPHPLIILLHGRHSSVYNPDTNSTVSGWPPTGSNLRIPSFLGYEYEAPILASYGFIVDSIGADAINAFDANTSDAGMLARAQLVEDQLNLWNQLNTTTTEPTAQPGVAQPGLAGKFTGTVNLQDVGLMGHSRGGEGVVEAYDLNQQLGSPYGIKAVYALAPVDFQRNPSLNVPFAVMLPYADGDVSDLQGMHFFDDNSLLAANDTAPSYEFLTMGTDHDLFNSVWTQGQFPAGAADDWAGSAANPSATRGADPYAGVVPNPSPTLAAPFPVSTYPVVPNPSTTLVSLPIATAFSPAPSFPTISAPERLLPQAAQAAETVYESAFFQMFLQGQTQYQPILDGDAAPPASLTSLAVGETPAIVYASYQPPANSAVRLDVNDTLDPSNLTVNALGGAVTQGGLLTYTMAGNGTIPGETSLVLPNESGSKQPDSVASSQAPTKGGLSQLVLDWNSPSAFWQNDLPAADQNVSGYGTIQFRAAVNPSDIFNNALSEDFSVALTDAHGKTVEVPVSDFTNWLFYPPGKVSPLPKLINQGIRIPLTAFVGIDLTQVTAVRFNFDKSASGGLTVTELEFADASPTGKVPTTT
jgi:hypothetical protein